MKRKLLVFSILLSLIIPQRITCSESNELSLKAIITAFISIALQRFMDLGVTDIYNRFMQPKGFLSPRERQQTSDLVLTRQEKILEAQV